MGLDVRSTVLEYLNQQQENSLSDFIAFLKQSFKEGKLNHNSIRRAVLQRSKSNDQSAVYFGSLLLQMDNEDIYTILNEKQ